MPGPYRVDETPLSTLGRHALANAPSASVFPGLEPRYSTSRPCHRTTLMPTDRPVPPGSGRKRDRYARCAPGKLWPERVLVTLPGPTLVSYGLFPLRRASGPWEKRPTPGPHRCARAIGP